MSKLKFTCFGTHILFSNVLKAQLEQNTQHYSLDKLLLSILHDAKLLKFFRYLKLLAFENMQKQSYVQVSQN